MKAAGDTMDTISAIWQGSVRHRRFAPRSHAFSYGLFMLGLDLDLSLIHISEPTRPY